MNYCKAPAEKSKHSERAACGVWCRPAGREPPKKRLLKRVSLESRRSLAVSLLSDEKKT
jgi:hypothetical protein